MKAKRIYFPALSLLVTLGACFVVFFACYVAFVACYVAFVTTTGLIPFAQQPVWMQACSQSGLFRKATRLAIAVATVGSALTVWLLLKTEAPEQARLHFKNLSIGIGGAAVSGVLLVLAGIAVAFIQAALSPQGLAQLGSMAKFAQIAFAGSAIAGVFFGALALITFGVPYALFTLVSRARQPFPTPLLDAAQPPYNSPEYFHHTL